MSDFDRNVAARGSISDRAVAIDAGLRAHMIRVYNYMASAVALTGIVAWLTYNAAVTSTGALTAFGQAIFSGPMMIVLMLGTLGLVFFLSFRIDRLQYTTALTVFMVYAALLGVTLSSIFLVYTGASITRVFFISAASFGALSLWGYTTQRDLTGMGSFLIMGLFGLIIAMIVNIFLKSTGLDFVISAATFGAMSLYGYTTKRDLSGFGSFLFMGLIGIILASLVNIWLASSMLQFVISIVGVLVFVGLTAYDTQQIKEMYDVNDDGTASGRKAIMGALRLYLDFLNLFIMLLQLFGDRR